MYKFKITNQHGCVIWEGEASSFYQAWKKMFDACKYPMTARRISQQINLGMWIEKVK